MTYAVEILRSAQKELASLQRADRERLAQAIRNLGENPRPVGSKKLIGREAWRIREGRFRIIYEIHDSRLLVMVIRVGDRKEIYR